METTDPIRPDFSPDQALLLAKEHFGLSLSQPQPLPSDRDQNFRLSDPAKGRRFVLKISHSQEDPQVLDLQNRILEHLNRSGFPSSNVLFTPDGREVTSVSDPAGVSFLVRLLTWVPGTPLFQVQPHRPYLLRALGAFLGGMDRALEDFSHPAQDRELKWDLRQAGRVLADHLEDVEDPRRRLRLERAGRGFLDRLRPLVPELRLSVIHGDGNDHNVLVDPREADGEQDRISGLVDFGDAGRSYTVAEVAIAGSYAMLGKGDPLAAASQVVEGYHRAYPLREAEVAALLPLMGLRLCTSVAMAAYQKRREPENPYLTVSETPAWDALAYLEQGPMDLATARFREACGLDPIPSASRVRAWLEANGKHASPVVGMASSPGGGDEPGQVLPLDLSETPVHVLDLELTSDAFLPAPESHDLKGWTAAIFNSMDAAGAPVGVGRYDEVRSLYSAPIFRTSPSPSSEWRTVHMGMDLFMRPGAPVLAPFDAVVHSVAENEGELDYGPTVILEHRVPVEMGETLTFWTLYGHLDAEPALGLYPGQPISRGEVVARIGEPPGNGNWSPHLHFQIITDLLGMEGDFPGVAPPSLRDIWRALSPDPNLILGIPEPDGDEPEGKSAEGESEAERSAGARSAAEGGTDQSVGEETARPGRPSGAPLTPEERSVQEIMEVRDRLLGPTLSVAYQSPLKIVQGRGQFLVDHLGQRYLDCVNNVPHVGHGHPRVVRAGQAQMATLNTNTRYLHDHLVEYAERLVATLPEPLSVVYFVCTGSEANELALRMARTHTGREDVIVVEGAYHGNTSAMVDMSPYKFDRPGGQGCPSWVHVAPMPDPYRGRYRAAAPESGSSRNSPSPGPGDEAVYLSPADLGGRYAQDVAQLLSQAQEGQRPIAAFFCEPLLGCGGQIVLPDGYMDHAFRAVRDAGGLCVADEVQVGFGRVGSHFWGFETQGVVPDIVTLGKPMGNGHPVSAVVTTPDVARSFDNGMEYFNTFGGNPVSCAIGLAVLDVIRDEGLQENALSVGNHILEGLRDLQERHPLVGDVRGRGLYTGVELVEDRATREPSPARARRVKERLREERILLSTDGPRDNVLKIKPPLVFTREDADHLVSTLDRVLGETAIRM